MIKSLLAQNPQPIGSPFTGLGPLGLETTTSPDAPKTFQKFISNTIGIMTVIAVIWFIFLFISGAIAYLSSGGDKGAVQNAVKRITNGIIGLVVVIAAVFLLDLVGNLIGYPDILNVSDTIDKLTP